MTKRVPIKEWNDQETDFKCEVVLIDFKLPHTLYGFEGKHHCGYVTVPFELSEETIYNITVHGGITYTNHNEDGTYTYGFDCAHAGDSIEEWTAEQVEKECIRMAQELKQHYPI